MRKTVTVLAIATLVSTVAMASEPPPYTPPWKLIERSAVVVDATLVDVSVDREIRQVVSDWQTQDLVRYQGVLRVHNVLAGGSIGLDRVPLNWEVDETVVSSWPLPIDFSSLSGDRAIWLLTYRDGELFAAGWDHVWILEGVSWDRFWTGEKALERLNRRENPQQYDQVDLIRRYLEEFLRKESSVERRPN